MSTIKSAFFADVANSLAGCQKVEQYLKLYIHEAYSFAKECINGRMPFNFHGDDVSNSSLEGLIKVFKKLSGNDSLVSDLNKFKEERNYLSHQAITSCYDGGGDFNEYQAGMLRPRILAIEPSSQQIAERIWEEYGKLLVSRHFQDLNKVRE